MPIGWWLPFPVDWRGPTITLSWTRGPIGVLERIRFALDPTPEAEQFYFGEI